MYQATMAIYEALSKRDGLKVFTEERGSTSNVWLGFRVKNGPSYTIRFISKDDDNDVAVRVIALTRVEEEKVPVILPVINELNVKYRFVKFTLDKDNDINVEYDYPVSCSNPGESAEEIMIRFVQIIDESYPSLMRAMWA